MKKKFVHIWLATVAVGVLVAAPAEPARFTVSFDANWRFLKADSPGAEQPQFDDRAWRKLDVPHDWSIAGPFSKTNRTGGSGGFLPSGVGWYRKEFTLPDMFSNQCVFVEFDGVMQNSEVWIDGTSLGKRPFGYVSFGCELTGHLNFGAGRTNVLAVRADTSEQPASRWYSGAGIYRHVRLVVTDPIHFEQNGIFISTPEVSETQAMVRVQTSVTNESDSPREISVMATLYGPPHSAPDGRYACPKESQLFSVPAGESIDVSFDVKIPWKPRLWDLEHPDLHAARVSVRSSGQTLDEETITFGIREAKFDADTGFWLNGRNFKIKGVCLHHDGGAFGAAVPLGVWEQRLKTLKGLGVNAIRTAHNPPAPEFLDLCDRLGFLVMDEMFDCWTVAKNPYDYHLYFNEWSKTDERDTIRRDRNHPSIILYSVGNEIHDTPKAEMAKGILQGLVEVAHEADPTRPVTQALFRPNVSHDYDNGLADMLDVVGQNYRENEILAAHEQKPSRKIIGTENRHERAAWVALRDHAPYAGQFLWSGIDYLGESRRWPVVAAGSGLLDHTGAPKPMAFERQSWWSDKPMVFITRRIATDSAGPTDPGYEPATQDALRRLQVLFPDWTPKNSTPHDENVEVYSNCKEVELFLNGKSLGSKPLNADASPRIWKVVYTPGTLKAVARNNDRVVATDELRTAGPPAKIQLSVGRADPALRDQDAQQRVPTDRIRLTADWNEVAFVRATVVDAHGVLVPSATNLITFKVSGPGVIAAVDNADNASHEPFPAGERHAFQGRCVAFVKASAPSGKIVLTASAPGLKSDEVVIKACPPVSAP
jgi:beta-galactosidase